MFKRFKFIWIILLGLAFVSACQKQDVLRGEGQVIDLNGNPIEGAEVTSGSDMTLTDSGGNFTIALTNYAEWVTVDHPNFISRTRPVTAEAPVRFSLTPDDGRTITLHFGGDMMFGRRYFDRNEDGNPEDGLIPVEGSVNAHLAILQPVLPLLADADITFVNLESPIVSEPFFDVTGSRPGHFHSTKEYVFASHPTAALALRQAGVDMLGLGNNHQYDTVEDGLDETLRHLANAGFTLGQGAFGAGSTEAEAWAPAIRTVRGQTVAFLGCTTINGREHPVSYVADDAAGKGGAADCEAEKIEEAVSSAVALYDTVIMMIHGGWEYGHEPSYNIQWLTNVARGAGASLVINHHPHVPGGFDWDGSSMVAWTLGNFAFDQTVWPTFESYMLVVHVRKGEVIRAYAEPLMVEDYAPKAVTGELADSIVRRAVGLSSAGFVVADGAVESDFQANYASEQVHLPSINGALVRLSTGEWIPDGADAYRLGRDLLWVGSFEDEDVDGDVQEGALWNLMGEGKTVTPLAAYSGEVGLRLNSSSNFALDNVATHAHRILIEPGTELSVIGQVRGSVNADVALQLSWYPDTRGRSSSRFVETVEIPRDEWGSFRFDVVAPDDAIAVGLYLRLAPPANGQSFVDFDDLAVIAWRGANDGMTVQYNYVDLLGASSLVANRSVLLTLD